MKFQKTLVMVCVSYFCAATANTGTHWEDIRQKLSQIVEKDREALKKKERRSEKKKPRSKSLSDLGEEKGVPKKKSRPLSGKVKGFMGDFFGRDEPEPSLFGLNTANVRETEWDL